MNQGTIQRVGLVELRGMQAVEAGVFTILWPFDSSTINWDSIVHKCMLIDEVPDFAR